MKIYLKYLALFSIVFLMACGPGDEEKAKLRLTYAQKLLEQQDTVAALSQLDSIAVLYPKAIYVRNAAKNMGRQIRLELLQRKEAELDSLNARIAELEKPFEKQKTEFDRYTRYVHKRQTFNRAWDRSFLQVHLNERGEIYLSSNYYGDKWLNHVGIRVYDKGDDAKTDTIPLGTIDNHHSDFMEKKWERVSYRNGKDNGVIRFIAENVDRRLKAVFLGERYYYIILEQYDKEAVRDAWLLSKAIKKRRKLQREMKQLSQAINK